MLPFQVSRIVPVLMATLLLTPILIAQQAKDVPTTPAPVPVQIATAKKVFISNFGIDSTSLAKVFEREGGQLLPYNRFYAAMKDWGRFELVSSPAEADLIFEIRFRTPYQDTPQLEVAILDAKTHFTLWRIIEKVDAPMRISKWGDNFEQGMNRLMDDLKKLAAPPASTANAQK